MTNEEAMRIAQGLITDFKCESDTMVDFCNTVIKALKKESLAVPENPTNGDMLQAMFPYGTYGTNGNWVHVFGVGGNGVLVFTLEWWYAPYKKEGD